MDRYARARAHTHTHTRIHTGSIGGHPGAARASLRYNAYMRTCIHRPDDMCTGSIGGHPGPASACLVSDPGAAARPHTRAQAASSRFTG